MISWLTKKLNFIIVFIANTIIVNKNIIYFSTYKSSLTKAGGNYLFIMLCVLIFIKFLLYLLDLYHLFKVIKPLWHPPMSYWLYENSVNSWKDAYTGNFQQKLSRYYYSNKNYSNHKYYLWFLTFIVVIHMFLIIIIITYLWYFLFNFFFNNFLIKLVIQWYIIVWIYIIIYDFLLIFYQQCISIAINSKFKGIYNPALSNLMDILCNSGIRFSPRMKCIFICAFYFDREAFFPKLLKIIWIIIFLPNYLYFFLFGCCSIKRHFSTGVVFYKNNGTYVTLKYFILLIVITVCLGLFL